MKTLGLCFLFLSSVLVINAPAQEQPNAPQLNTDKAAIQKWLAHQGQPKWRGVWGGRIFFPPHGRDGFFQPLGGPEPSCVYICTSPVEGENPNSDVTSPPGYTNRVGLA